MEYAGKLSSSSSERSCLNWHGNREMLFLTQRFPGGWRKSPKSRCRNPDGDPAGPWCYVQRRGGHQEEKDYCDVPFCDEPG
ncbi:hypothetical protein PR048_018565 [Dryococelus australis]|uniref:Kringle domain-containing protein n=1 Tax=Dryococelus australis TaxID=614101 RepID=A0ABQ9HCM3_9NEOP|nr:hypothetical protein PR048_018565 [Dryococelus australis]